MPGFKRVGWQILQLSWPNHMKYHEILRIQLVGNLTASQTQDPTLPDIRHTRAWIFNEIHPLTHHFDMLKNVMR